MLPGSSRQQGALLWAAHYDDNHHQAEPAAEPLQHSEDQHVHLVQLGAAALLRDWRFEAEPRRLR
jgi:hypothetical protein